MQRKRQRELIETTEKLLANPPSVNPVDLPPIDAQLPNLSTPGEVVMPLPGMPLPDIPLPQKEVQCQECSAKFVVKDMRLTKTKCPICSAIVDF